MDSTDDSANYIHILDANYKTTYYCPCCKRIVKPRAAKKNVDYEKQPHFHHESGGCSEESYIHYMCKTKLFEIGCKFKVIGIEYVVSSIEIEKTLHTGFGDYRPDIIINTKCGKTFFFEIKYSNHKTELYAPKWDELGNDVVEVEAREFINNKHYEKIPEFKLIYSDGECFIKSYSRTDYEDTIAKRKIEWKRQDKLNYKIQWERLDWFWEVLCKYKNGHSTIDDVLKMYRQLEFEDMDFCIQIIKKMKCIDLYKDLISIINSKFFDIIKTHNIYPYKKVNFNQTSPRIFYIEFEIDRINNCAWFNSYCLYKKIEYYGLDILNTFINIISDEKFKKYTIELCPCYSFIKQKNYKHRLNNRMLYFYLNERKSIYWETYYNIKCQLFDDFKDVSENTYLKNSRIENIIDNSDYKKTLTKNQHKKRMCRNDVIFENLLKTNAIIKRINSCKNKMWNCNYSGLPDENLYIQLGGCYVNSFTINVNNKSKYQIFKEIKSNMNDVLIKSKIQYNYVCNKYRLMEVANDK